MNDFGGYLRGLRKQKGYTLVELSEESGVSNPYLSQIENNKFTPSPGILRRLAEPLGVEYTTLLSKAGYVEDDSMLKELRNAKEERAYKLQGTNSAYVVDLSNLGDVPDLEHFLKAEPDPPFYRDVQLTDEELQSIINYIEFLLKKRTDIDFD